MKSKQILLMAALSLITSAFAEQYQVKYHVTPIAPGAGEGINQKGDVVGTLNLGPEPEWPSVDAQHAFLYKKGKITDVGVFVDLRNLPNRTNGYAVHNSIIQNQISEFTTGLRELHP